MTEQIPQNTMPINRVSKTKLKQATGKANPTMLYCLQLMDWALGEGLAGIPQKFRGPVQGTLEVMIGMDPAKAMAFLLGEDPEEPDVVSITAPEIAMDSPMEAAEMLLQALHSRMSAEIPGYPPV